MTIYKICLAVGGLVTGAVVLGGIYFRYWNLKGGLFTQTPRANKNKLLSLKGKTIIVTGSNSGIGYCTSLSLYKMGATVIMTCRDEIKANEAKKNILLDSNKDNNNNKDNDLNENNIIPLVLDLSSFKSIELFINKLELLINNNKINNLYGLINNGGVCGLNENFTNEGIAETWGINYVGTVYLTNLIIPLFTKQYKQNVENNNNNIHKPRILFVSSDFHLNGEIKLLPDDNNNKILFDDNRDKHGDKERINIYSNTKLAIVLHSIELAKRFKDQINIFSLTPGFVETYFIRDHKGFDYLIDYICYKLFAVSPDQGCQSLLYGIAAEELEGVDSFNKYIRHCKAHAHSLTNKYINDPEFIKKFWDLTHKSIQTLGGKINQF